MASPLVHPDEYTEHINITTYLIYTLLSLVIVIWIIHRRHRRSRLYKYGNKIPGPPSLPIFGNVFMAIGKKPEQFLKLGLSYRAIYGNVVRAWIGHKLVVFLTDAEDVEVILKSHVHINKPVEYLLFQPWIGDGLLTSSGQKWKSHRKLIAPTFHISILKNFIDVINKNSKHVIEKMRAESGKTFDVGDYMNETIIENLLETVMGTTKPSYDGSSNDYARAIIKMCDIIHQRQYKFWLRPEFLFKLTPLFSLQNKLLGIIHGLRNKVIQIKKKSYLDNKNKGITRHTTEKPMHFSVRKDNVIQDENTLSDNVFKSFKDDLDYNDENDVGEKKRLAFLDLMIESAQNGTSNITDNEIKEEFDTIMFAGHDTASLSSFVICLLGVHQDIQAKVHEELHEIFGDSDRPATFYDMLHMKYLERVILETLRLYPPVPIIGRELTEDVKIVTNNYLLPAGTAIVISPFGIQRNPRYYKDPNVFNPDNFLPENASTRRCYSFIPFSAGPRSCVGRKYVFMKLKVLLSTILREFRVISDVPEEDFVWRSDFVLRRADGFKIRLEPRN